MSDIKFTQQMADHICERLANRESLASICDEEGMPSVGTVTGWRRKHPEFDIQYLAAREMQAESLFEEMLDIADDGRNDWVMREVKKDLFVPVVDKEHIARSRVRIDTRWQMLKRMNPKRFGEKIELDHRSSDGTMSPKDMSDEQKAEKIAAIMAKAEARRKLAKSQPVADDLDGSDLV